MKKIIISVALLLGSYVTNGLLKADTNISSSWEK